jgi:nitroreductase
MEDLIESLHWRYAVKKFDRNRLLPGAQVEKLKQAFNLTATSFGLQPIRMAVLRNRRLQESLVAHSYGQRQVADASDVFVICTEDRIDREYIEAYFDRVRDTRGTSEEILEPYRKSLIDSFRRKTPEEIQAWATQQAYLALGNLLTACAVERIDSCPMEGFVPRAYGEVLGLSGQGLTPVLVLPIGYRAADDPFSGFRKVRRPAAESVITIGDTTEQ